MGKKAKGVSPAGEMQMMLADRRAANRADWARRHPHIASEERALRKRRVGLVSSWKHKNEGTHETHEHAQHQEGSLHRLYRTGAIDAEQLASAVEIAQVAERIAADVTVRTASLETRVDVTRIGDGGFYERLGQVRREVAYTEWRQALPQAAPVLDMIVGEAGLTIAARRYRIHNRKAKRLLIAALDRWPEILGYWCKLIDDKALAAAHARLAA